MMRWIKRLGVEWARLGKILNGISTRVIFSIIYLLIVPIFVLLQNARQRSRSRGNWVDKNEVFDKTYFENTY